MGRGLYAKQNVAIVLLVSIWPCLFPLKKEVSAAFDLSRLPRDIAQHIEGRSWQHDDIGLSGSTILLFDDRVLKIAPQNRFTINETVLLYWLEGKLPVPKVIQAATQDGVSYLLMTKLIGEMAMSDTSLQHMDSTVRALAAGLKLLWSVDISHCPCTNTLPEKLEQARHNIEHDLVDVQDFNPETFGEEGFTSVPQLYAFLEENRPAEDLVFSHGDYCLPNVFHQNGVVSGFLDWGTGGIADRWQDIALCVRSLRYNYIECAGYTESDCNVYKQLLFSELGMEPDEAKIRYYILLDELF